MKSRKLKTYTDGKHFGVCDIHGHPLYEAEFCNFNEAQAKRLAELYNSKSPPDDWEHAREILEKEGLITP